MERLRVHIITQSDPLFVPYFFDVFLREYPRNRIELTGIDLTPPLNQRRWQDLAQKVLGLFGVIGTAKVAAQQVWARLADKLLPLDLYSLSLRRLSLLYRVPLVEVPNVNSADNVHRLRELAPDVLLSVAASQIFKRKVLEVPRVAALNVHTGKLPKYRGMMPVFWQLLEGERFITITVHTMTPRLDAGEIVIERSFPVGEERSLFRIIERGKREGARAAIDALLAVAEGKARFTKPQGEEDYFSFPTWRDALRLKQKGFTIP